VYVKISCVLCEKNYNKPNMNEKKRSAPSPVQSEKAKESRNDVGSPSSSSWASAASGNSGTETPSERHLSPPPRGEATRWPTNRERQHNEGRQRTNIVMPIEENHLLSTEGAMRNNFTVEILKMNGKDLRSQVSGKFAVVHIYLKALGMNKDELESVIPKYRGNPAIIFKLKNVINIDEVFKGRANFSFLKRSKTEDGAERVDTYDCVIRGVREEGQPPTTSQRYTYLKIEGADLQVEPKTIKKWLMQYGTLMSDLVQEAEELGTSSEEEDLDLDPGLTWSTGTYSIKMLLQRPIHQFLPIDGKKIKVYHKGIKKMCSNCYQAGHLRMACQSNRVDWMSYVDNFVLNSGLDETYFGKWMEKLQNWRETMDDVHAKNVQRAEENRKRKEEMTKRRRETVEEITGILQAQKQQEAVQEQGCEDKHEEGETTPEIADARQNTAGVAEDEGARDRGRKKQTKQRLSESDETSLLQDAFSSLTVDQLSGLLKAKTGRTGRKSKADAREEEEIRKTLAKKMAGTHTQNE